MNTEIPSLVEPYPGQFRITWRNGGYFVSAPNYNGGEVVPVETVRSLEVFQSNELLRLRAELETERRKVEVAKAAMAEFVRRCEAKEILSRKSYATFKDALAALTPTERTEEEK